MPSRRNIEYHHTIQITAGQAISLYPQEVDAILDEARESSSEAVQGISFDGLKWMIGYNLPRDMEPSPHKQALMAALRAGTKMWLYALGNSGVRWKSLPHEIFTIPEKIMGHLDQKAIALSRPARPEGQLLPATPKPLKNNGLLDGLHHWLSKHPKADKRLAEIANKAITLLMETGE